MPSSIIGEGCNRSICGFGQGIQVQARSSICSLPAAMEVDFQENISSIPNLHPHTENNKKNAREMTHTCRKRGVMFSPPHPSNRNRMMPPEQKARRHAAYCTKVDIISTIFALAPKGKNWLPRNPEISDAQCRPGRQIRPSRAVMLHPQPSEEGSERR